MASDRTCRQHATAAGSDCASLCFAITYTANFKLPEEGVMFDKVEFIELSREEAQPLVEKYNREGRAAQPPDSKRFRGNDRDRFSRFSTSAMSLT